MNSRRRAGVLAHISSLPGKYGIGTLGSDAFAFCDFLSESGFSVWQMLPVNPHGAGFSPYSSISSFAGNPLFISPDGLYEMGLITRDELMTEELPNTERIDYKTVILKRELLLRRAFLRFSDFSSLSEFSERDGESLSDYASFMSIREELGVSSWLNFPNELRTREGLDSWRASHKDGENYYKFEQYIFSLQWNTLRKYAASSGISLIGDVPIYVAPDSCDVWSHPEIFNLSETFTPLTVSGCPPDSFSPEGQLWGNPTYRWDVLSETGFSWWISRLSRLSWMFDTVRLDHFRGFDAYWAVPYGSENAKEGKWLPGPGKDFFSAVRCALPNLDMIAEDLGFLTDSVYSLRDEFSLPGMHVLQFAFDGDDKNIHLPHNYPENSVAYTGTHDNDTLCGFISSATEETLRLAKRYVDVQDDDSLFDALLDSVWASRAKDAVAPIGDFLRLPSSSRMNTPSTVNDRNWRFRIGCGALESELSEKLLRLNSLHNRI